MFTLTNWDFFSTPSQLLGECWQKLYREIKWNITSGSMTNEVSMQPYFLQICILILDRRANWNFFYGEFTQVYSHHPQALDLTTSESRYSFFHTAVSVKDSPRILSFTWMFAKPQKPVKFGILPHYHIWLKVSKRTRCGGGRQNEQFIKTISLQKPFERKIKIKKKNDPGQAAEEESHPKRFRKGVKSLQLLGQSPRANVMVLYHVLPFRSLCTCFAQDFLPPLSASWKTLE